MNGRIIPFFSLLPCLGFDTEAVWVSSFRSSKTTARAFFRAARVRTKNTKLHNIATVIYNIYKNGSLDNSNIIKTLTVKVSQGESDNVVEEKCITNEYTNSNPIPVVICWETS